MRPFPETSVNYLDTSSCESAVNKLAKGGFWKQAADASVGWLLHERKNWKTDNCSLRHHLHCCTAAWGSLPAGECLSCRRELWFGLFVYKREESSPCPPAAVKTLLENQTKVSTQELTLEKKKTRPNKQTSLNERPSGLKHRPLG